MIDAIIQFFNNIFFPLMFGIGGVMGIIWCFYYFTMHKNKVQPDTPSNMPMEGSKFKQKRVISHLWMTTVLIASILVLIKAIAMLWNTFSAIEIKTMDMVDNIWNFGIIALCFAGVILGLCSIPYLNAEQKVKKNDTHKVENEDA